MASSALHASLPPLPLPAGISENYVHGSPSGLTFHILEAGNDPERQKPLILLCHGFPELAFSWRKVMLPLAEAGYHVVAFDQRGYGRTTGWDNSSFIDTDMSQFALTSYVRDAETVVAVLGYRQVECIIGHDFGALTASSSALMHPNLFKGLIMLSHPFKAVKAPSNENNQYDIQAELAKLPQPRKPYKWYNSTKDAAGDWENPPQGLEDFLRGYLHVKSANWKDNQPHKLEGWNAEEVAKMPYYYVLPLEKTMPETIKDMMATEDISATEDWISKEDLNVYVQEWSRTGFQGALNQYRTVTDPAKMKDLQPYVGKTIECPSIFISGAQDWGNYQEPGVIESLPKSCSDFRGVKFIQGAGHWPQQEQPKLVVDQILQFLRNL